MTNQELIKQIDDLQGLGEISFEQWWAMKSAVVQLLPDELKTGYAETEENCKGCEAKALLSACRAARLAYYRAEHSTPERASALGKVQEAERAADRFLGGYTKAEENCKGCMGPCGMCEDTVIRDARELEEIVRLGAKMRTAQKAYFRTRTSENLEESKRLEREFDVRATRKLDEKPTAATLFG